MAADHISQWRTRQSGVHHEKLQLREVTVDHQPCSESAVRLPQQQAGYRRIWYVTTTVRVTIVCTTTLNLGMSYINGDCTFYSTLMVVWYFCAQVVCRLWANISQVPVSVSFRIVSGPSVTCRTQPPNRWVSPVQLQLRVLVLVEVFPILFRKWEILFRLWTASRNQIFEVD